MPMTKSIILLEIDLTLTKNNMYQNMHRQGMLGDIPPAWNCLVLKTD